MSITSGVRMVRWPGSARSERKGCASSRSFGGPPRLKPLINVNLLPQAERGTDMPLVLYEQFFIEFRNATSYILVIYDAI
jgi:hypothetical protein